MRDGIPLPALLSLAAGETYGVLTGTGVFGVVVFLAAWFWSRKLLYRLLGVKA